MKIHHYQEMMAHFARPREKFSNGTLPKPKPYTKEMFKKQSDLYLQGYFGTDNKDLYKNNLEDVFEKGIKEGVVSEEEAIEWIQGRKKIYTTLMDEARRQGDQPAELPTSYGVEPDINEFEDGGRVGLEGGSDILTVDAHGSKTGAQQIENAPKGWTSDEETFDIIAALKIPVSKKIKLLADLQYGKYRDQIEYKDQDVYLEDPKSYRERKFGISYNEGGEGLSGHAKVNVDTGDPEAYVQFTKKFEDGGRVVGRLKAAGPLLLAPYLMPYAAAFLGIAGVTGLALRQKIQNYFTNKPEDVPKFKEYLKDQNVQVDDREPTNWSGSFADDQISKSVPVPTGEGDYIGDTGQKEAERERIAREEKKKYDDIRWGKRKEINVPISTGHPPLTPEKWEPPVNKPIEVPQLEGFPDLSEEFNKPQILTMAKEKTFAKDKTEVKKKLDAIEPYRGADFIGTSTKKDRTKDKAFLEAFELFKNTHFGGNESAAARAINESRERIRALRLRITTTDRREEGGKFSTAHEEKITTEVPENPIRSVDATTAVKKDQNYFKDFLTKENKNEYMSPQNLANVLDFYFKNKGERDNFIQGLNKLKVKSKEVPGKIYKEYKLSDVVNKLTEKNKTKNVAGDVLSKTNRKLAENKLDPVLYTVLDTIKARVNTNIADLKYKSSKPNYAVDDIGHPISIKETNEFPKLFKNSDVNKINSLVYEDPLINQEVKKVTGYETKHIKWFKELNDMVGKEITKDQRTRLEDIQQEMEDNYLELLKNIGKFDNLKAILKKARPDLNISDSYIKYLTNQVDRQSKIDIKIPNIGEKFKSEDIFVDMSNVDERYIIGHINKINPTAKVFNDLSKEEKGIYEANVLAQNAEILADYYRKIGLSENEIKDMKDDFYYPMREYKIRKAMGGPVYGFYADQIKNLKIP